MTVRARLVLLAGVIAGVAGLSVLVAGRADLRTDMGFFMPRAQNADAAFVLDRLRSGPASNIVMIRLSGAPAASLARASDRLAGQIRGDARFVFVANGRSIVDRASLAWLLRFRYVLNPEIGASEFETKSLRAGLESLRAVLATSMGIATKELLFADPTGRVQRIVKQLGAGQQIAQRHGVWFSKDAKSALLVARTRARGFDLNAQADALAQLRRWAAQPGPGSKAVRLRLELSGPGVFAVAAREQIRSDMILLTTAASILVLLILVAVMRSAFVIVALGVPLVSGIIGGAAAVQLIFGNIHGITLTFGATLLGIAIDYPLHLACHSGGQSGAPAAARRIWPVLRLSALTTSAAFLPFVLSSFPGLAQLGVMSIAGLLVAAAATRWLLPYLMPAEPRVFVPDLPWRRLVGGRQVGFVRAASIALLLGGIAWAALGPARLWEDNLARLSPLPAEQLRLDRALRAELSVPDTRYMIVIAGPDAETVLRKSETASAHLEALRRAGALVAYEAPSNYLPSARTQARRRSMLPGDAALARNLADALVGLPFRKDAFAGFLGNVAAARAGDPATLQTLSGAVAQRLNAMLFRSRGAWYAMIVFRGGPIPVAALRAAPALTSVGARVLDLKHEADALVAGYRSETLNWLAIGGALGVLVLAIGLRRARDVLRVIAPVVFTVTATGTILVLAGAALSVFHLLALLVVAGIGLDYALFLQHHGGGRDGENTTRAVTLCGLTTVGVFTVLAFSALPVLHSIGLTVALGTALMLFVTRLFLTATD
ncbi:MAG TPA: MMPL family transporter [Alphaproteobacteria bacterium]|nr:MMPL family transporter [Alphaproteobacteria bacterium]